MKIMGSLYIFASGIYKVFCYVIPLAAIYEMYLYFTRIVMNEECLYEIIIITKIA